VRYAIKDYLISLVVKFLLFQGIRYLETTDLDDIKRDCTAYIYETSAKWVTYFDLDFLDGHWDFIVLCVKGELWRQGVYCISIFDLDRSTARSRLTYKIFSEINLS
jgi:hypothetical protein